jgi:uncharacterized protein
VPLVELGKNFATGDLVEGCLFCRDGAKMVLYLTGDCQSHCFYCPVDRDRMYTDRTFANERETAPDDIDAAIEEARTMKALGVGITGGDPMTRPERVERYLKAFKSTFGRAFHTHLYTQNVFDPQWISRLEAAGLDELRFHPPVQWWDQMEKSPYDALIKAALKSKMRVGAEVPAIPHKQASLMALVTYLDRVGCGFLNLNELEFSQANVDQLISRGHRFESDESNTVDQSKAASRWVAEESVRRGLKMVVHFCASTYKDDVQLRKRFLRRAESIERPLDAVTPEGTILHGAVEGPDVEAIHARLTQELEVPLDLVQIDRDRGRVDVAGWILEEHHERLVDLGRSYIVEVHPSSTRLEVERMPLPFPEE